MATKVFEPPRNLHETTVITIRQSVNVTVVTVCTQFVSLWIQFRAFQHTVAGKGLHEKTNLCTVFLYQKGGDFQSMTFNVYLDIPFTNATLLNKKYQWIYQQHLAVWLVNSRGYHVPPSVYTFQAPKIQGAPVAIKGIAIGRSLWTQVLDLAQDAFMCWCLLIMWCGKWVVDVLVSSGKMTTLHEFFRLVMTRSCQLPYDFEDSGVL